MRPLPRALIDSTLRYRGLAMSERHVDQVTATLWALQRDPRAAIAAASALIKKFACAPSGVRASHAREPLCEFAAPQHEPLPILFDRREPTTTSSVRAPVAPGDVHNVNTQAIDPQGNG